MESSSSLNCWLADVLALCLNINQAVEDKKAHVNEQQCFLVKLLADAIQRYVKEWITVCGEGAWWNLTKQVGDELLRVVDNGLQLIIQSGQKDFSAIPVVTLGFKGELTEIIDDARIYVQMINRFILHSLHSLHKHRSVVEKLMIQVELDCHKLHSNLEIAYQQDKNTLINSSESQPNVPMSSLLLMLKTEKPNINNNDLSEEKRLGHGSFGVVHRAEWHKIPVAVKSFLTDQHLQMELTIFQKLLRFDSSHIVRMLGYSASRKLVLELLDRDMEKQITGQESPLPLIQSLDLMLQIAKSVRHLHNIDVVHRDLKPANILLQSRKDGSLLVKLSDFGVSKDFFQTELPNTVVGTMKYMAPEMKDGDGKYSRKVDIYSFGLICREILTGSTYIPKKLANLIDSCIDKEAAKRPSFEDICDSLWLVKEEALTKVIVDTDARALKFTINGLAGMRIIYPLSCNQDNANPQQDISCNRTELTYILPPIMPTFTGKRAIYSLSHKILEGGYSLKDLPLDNLVDIVVPLSLLAFNGNSDQIHINKSYQHHGIFGDFKELLKDQGKKFNLYLNIYPKSEDLSALLSTATTRNTFVNSILGLLKSHPIFNGFLIEWRGTISEDGFDNLLLTLEALRKELPPGSFMIGLLAKREQEQRKIGKAFHLLDQVHLRFRTDTRNRTDVALKHVKMCISNGVPASKIFITGSLKSLKYFDTDGIGMISDNTGWEWGPDYKELPVVGSEEKCDDFEGIKITYAHDPIRREIYSYDNHKSVLDKAKYIKESDLGGIAVFYADSDFPYKHERSVIKVLHDHLTHG